jgi:lysophospholipase L1-like esterase
MRKLKYRLVLIFLGLCAGMLIAEVALRLFVEQQSKRLFIYDAQLGWRGKPHGCGVYILDANDIRVPFCYNNLGWRDEDVIPRRSSGPRVVMLGDSFVESLEVQYDKIYHNQLERRLQKSLEDNPEVIVLGMAGYGTSQELLAFRKYKNIADADIVLTVFYTGNDFEDNQRKQYAYLNRDGALVFPDNQPPSYRVRYMQFRRWLYEHSQLVYFVKNSAESLMAIDFSPPSHEVAGESARYQEMITHKLLLQTRSEVENAGATYGVVVIPSLIEVREGDLTKVELVAGWCAEHDIPALDLSTVLSEDHYLQEEGHFNHAGHALVAEEIFRFLKSEFIPHPASGFAAAGEP